MIEKKSVLEVKDCNGITRSYETSLFRINLEDYKRVVSLLESNHIPFVTHESPIGALAFEMSEFVMNGGVDKPQQPTTLDEAQDLERVFDSRYDLAVAIRPTLYTAV